MEKRRKVGIMGGTFDPIHIGHLILGEAAYQQFQLDQVLFLPAGNPPHKQNRAGRANNEQRVEMVKRAISTNPHFDISLAEMTEDGYTYTYRTLERFRAENPDTDYYFIIGADSLFDFDQWMEPQRIMNACTLVVATRNQIPDNVFQALLDARKKQFPGEYFRLDTPNLDVASSHLREMIQNDESVKYYLPDQVIEYITENSIYKTN